MWMKSRLSLANFLETRRWTVYQSEGRLRSVSGQNQDEGNVTQLSQELKSGTRKVHRDAERVHFVRNFIKGQISKDLYKEMLSDLYFVYSALEGSCPSTRSTHTCNRCTFQSSSESTAYRRTLSSTWAPTGLSK